MPGEHVQRELLLWCLAGQRYSLETPVSGLHVPCVSPWSGCAAFLRAFYGTIASSSPLCESIGLSEPSPRTGRLCAAGTLTPRKS